MRQTTLCVPLEVKPTSYSRLSALITEFRLRQELSETKYDVMKQEVPTAHFMSLSVFPHPDFDPIFVLEANFDGQPGVFWAQLEAAFADELRAMVRCCKRPRDEDGPLYDAVTKLGSRSPIAPYLETRTQKPSVFHHGNRGLDRDTILKDEELFLAIRNEIDGAGGVSPYRGIPAEAARLRLRAVLLPHFPWLTERPPSRIPGSERFVDILKLLLFAAAVLLVLSLPGLILVPRLPDRAYVILMLATAVVLAVLLWTRRRGLPGTEVAGGFPWAILEPRWLIRYFIAIAVYVIVSTAIIVPLVMGATAVLQKFGVRSAMTLADTLVPVGETVLLALVSLIVTVPLVLLRVRYLEKRDSSRDEPFVDERTLAEMARREDWIAQNHMGSIVLIKPGVLRSVVIRAGHLGLGLLLRVIARDGYLGSMRTVHFAHWAFLNNGSRLLFLSNYDHSWDSYLDDFIEKASKGLTISWGSGVGFPPARFLLLDGAAHGRQFKTWALASRAVTRFWYSAYRTLTVDQIERNHRIANGLRAPRLSERDAAAWMRDL